MFTYRAFRLLFNYYHIWIGLNEISQYGLNDICGTIQINWRGNLVLLVLVCFYTSISRMYFLVYFTVKNTTIEKDLRIFYTRLFYFDKYRALDKFSV